ncbi:hypothetical protein SAMN06265174_102378 [Dietzia kunjamensis subsp. schimae]|uniref:Uncharacterized protein n=1 Tax=Dietzia kunjamensis subsp. schimae TaxID=498198 RepID=A0ABY1MZJ4_9ACTN|nr:hypothetical protein [Dietzia kunjamensis]MBB1015076.1 hypothetical protein [Dietzia kunjamensis subsp. schimae]SMO56992.1 hypothetical protein SAMN06265174_102378 [Dietzia kunjamensis subsp. schimae]
MTNQTRNDHPHDDLERRSPLGVLLHSPVRDSSEKSETWQTAAFNLAEKALRKALAGDDAAVRRLISRMADLEFDELMGRWPQLVAADQILSGVLEQGVEEFEEEKDLYEAAYFEEDDELIAELEEEEPRVSVATGIYRAAYGADPVAFATLRASILDVLSDPWRQRRGGVHNDGLQRVADRLPEGARARDLPRERSENELAGVIRAHLVLAARMVEEFRAPLNSTYDSK